MAKAKAASIAGLCLEAPTESGKSEREDRFVLITLNFSDSGRIKILSEHLRIVEIEPNERFPQAALGNQKY